MRTYLTRSSTRINALPDEGDKNYRTSIKFPFSKCITTFITISRSKFINTFINIPSSMWMM